MSTISKIWNKFRNKTYRDAFVGAHISNTIAAQIGAMREAAGLTQTALANKIGTGQSRISALEDPNNSNVEIATLRRLASAFDVALTVRFIPFSELAEWSTEHGERDLAVTAFGEDHIPGFVPASRPTFPQDANEGPRPYSLPASESHGAAKRPSIQPPPSRASVV